jgi:hypothetical protein
MAHASLHTASEWGYRISHDGGRKLVVLSILIPTVTRRLSIAESVRLISGRAHGEVAT